MQRNTVIQAAKNVSRMRVSSPAIVRPALAHAIRLNSTQPPSTTEAPAKPPKTPEQIARRQALERQNDLQRDWDPKHILLYEDFLPKTQNPSPDAYIIDVREPDEVIQGMIPSAVNLPLSILGEALHMPKEQFAEKFGFEKPATGQEITFYCRSGMRSSTASDVARRNGYTNILNYKGSWIEWTAKQNEKKSS